MTNDFHSEAILRPLPITMKSPRDKRQGPNGERIWRDGVLQVWITRACDKACFGCTQGSNLAGKPGMMSLEQYKTALDSLMGYFGVVGMFGGNPALHPQFVQMCDALRNRIPFDQRGLWCNHPKGKGSVMRATFNTAYSNLNVHLDREAYDEFVRDWPECRNVLKGLDSSWPEASGLPPHRVGDARHSPVYTAMQDLIPDEEERWRLIGRCDVNQYWSSMICVFRNELRGYFCEIAGAQAMLHQAEPKYPDLGLMIEPGWWNQGMDSFDAQVRYHCHACGFPLRGLGDLAIGGHVEQVTKTHENIYRPKVKDRAVQVVDQLDDIKPAALARGTDYIQNGAI